VADRIAYVLGRFPVLSETFILREITDLVALGVPIDVYALSRGADEVAQPVAEGLLDRVMYRPPVWSLALPRWSVLRYAARRPRRFLSLLRDARRALSPGRAGRSAIALTRLAAACVFARTMEQRGTRHIHAHFLGAPTQVAFMAADLLSLPFSVAAHASDVFVRRRLTEFDCAIAREATTVVACSRFLAERLTEAHGIPREAIAVIHHGIKPESVQITRQLAEPPLILAVGRLVEKKGFHHLITACALLRERGVGLRCEIVGEGPERSILEGLIAAAGLEEMVTLSGALPFERVRSLYATASVLAVPSVPASDGDMDGLPNVIPEAAVAGVPIVATSVSAIPEFVRDGFSGLLVAEHDARGLADAIGRILGDPVLAEEMTRNARTLAEGEFSAAKAAESLAGLFAGTPEAGQLSSDSK